MKSNVASNGRLDKSSKAKKQEVEVVNNTESSQIHDPNLDPVLKQKIQQVMDMTMCTQDNAIFALHDSDNDPNAAVILLLESDNNMKNGWQEQKTKSKKKQSTQAAADNDDSFHASTDNDNDDSWKETRHNDNKQTYGNVRNPPPRMQRGWRREYRSRDDGGRDGSSGGYNSERRFGERGRGRGRGGRGRGGFNRDSGGFNRGGFGRSGDNHMSGEKGESGGTQIGTWTSEADANPKTDSWGEVFNADEDNQWQGDLKGTHVFESSTKADTFPTPTEFDPASASALPTVTPPQQQQHSLPSSSINGSSTSTQSPAHPVTSMAMDPMFPKQTVQALTPPSSMYDNQLAAESIKTAIGIPTQQQQMSDNTVKSNKVMASANSSIGMPAPTGLPQRQVKQQRSKLPPPSTKIPTAPVEMPHTSTMVNQLGVQFGTLELPKNVAAGLSFDSSSLGGSTTGVGASYPSTSTPSSSQMPQQQAMPATMYSSTSAAHTSQQVPSGPEPIPFPNAPTQSAQQQQGGRGQHLQHNQGNNSNSNTTMYHSSSPSGKTGSQAHYGSNANSSSQYKPTQSSSSHSSHSGGSAGGSSHSGSSHHLPSQSHPSGADRDNSSGASSNAGGGASHPTQAFQSSRANTSGGSNFYQLTGQDGSRGTTSNTYTQSSMSQQSASPASTLPSHSQQYTNSLYSNTDAYHHHQQQQHMQQQPSAYHYNAGVSSVTSLSGSTTAPITSHITPSQQNQAAVNSTRTSKPPPNLPPPTNTGAAAAIMPLPANYIMGSAHPNYYGQGAYFSTEDMQKYHHMLSGNNYYEQNPQFALSTTSVNTFQAGSGDVKMTAQSPTVQGAQSTANQSQHQTTPSNAAQSQGHQQHQTFMTAVPPGYNYYYHGAPYGVYSAPGVGIPGGTTGLYTNQQKGGSSSGTGNVSSSAAANTYYPVTTMNNSYEDGLHSAHTTDYTKNMYGAGKQANTLPAGANSTDIHSLYKNASNSQNVAAAAAATMYGSGAATGYLPAPHMLAAPHLLQSQLAASANTQDSSVGGRGSQSVTMPKSHSKQSYYSGSSSNWNN